MKRKLIGITLVAIVSLVCMVSQSIASPALFFEIGGDTPSPGELDVSVMPFDSFVLDVYLRVDALDYEGKNGVYGASFRTLFDNGAGISMTNLELNDTIWDPAWSKLIIEPSYGEITALDYFDWGQAYGDMLIATITFSADGITGTSAFTTEDFGATDGDFCLWPDFAPFDSDVTYHGGTINVVPIPSGLILLGSGLIGLIGLGRRRMKRS